MKDERLVQEEGQYGNICSSFLTIVQKWPLHLSDAAEKQNSFRKRTKSQREGEEKCTNVSHITHQNSNNWKCHVFYLHSKV